MCIPNSLFESRLLSRARSQKQVVLTVVDESVEEFGSCPRYECDGNEHIRYECDGNEHIRITRLLAEKNQRAQENVEIDAY